jgi:solute carrier family 8 (sodium/calcium exchanger)
MTNADPVEAAKALVAQLPAPAITSIQARINASRALTGQRFRQSAGAPVTAELVDQSAAKSKVHPTGGDGLALVGKCADEEVQCTSPIEISFEAPTIIAKESCGELRIGVVLSRPAPDLARGEEPLSVAFTTMDGTAEAGTDYIESKGRLVFHPGTRRAEVCVTIVEDDAFEPDETFTVRDQFLFQNCHLSSQCCFGIGCTWNDQHY